MELLIISLLEFLLELNAKQIVPADQWDNKKLIMVSPFLWLPVNSQLCPVLDGNYYPELKMPYKLPSLFITGFSYSSYTYVFIFYMSHLLPA